MARLRVTLAVVILLAGWFALFVAIAGMPATAAVPDDGVEFQDGSGNQLQTLQVGETASVYVRDLDLGTIQTSVATWSSVSSEVTTTQWWSLANGAPHPSAHALSDGSGYDTSTPANTPIIAVTSAKVNGVTTLLADINSLTGEIKLANDVNAGSTLTVTFSHEVVDSYSTSSRRVIVTSTSDIMGEPVSVSEVSSETDPTPSAVSALFAGLVLISDDAAALADGDGAVWVQPGDDVTVTYFGPAQSNVIATYRSQTEFPTPTPTPTPTSGPAATSTPANVPAVTVWALVISFGAFGAAMGMRRSRR